MENESVVAATLKKFAGKIRLVEARDTLKGFRFQSGVTSWPFLHMKKKSDCDEIDELKKKEEWVDDGNFSYFNEYPDIMSVPESQRGQLRETMFCSHYNEEILSQLPKCLRVLPHH